MSDFRINWPGYRNAHEAMCFPAVARFTARGARRWDRGGRAARLEILEAVKAQAALYPRRCSTVLVETTKGAIPRSVASIASDELGAVLAMPGATFDASAMQRLQALGGRRYS